MDDALPRRRWNFWAEASLLLGVVPIAITGIASRYDLRVSPRGLLLLLILCPTLTIVFGLLGRRRAKEGPIEGRIVAEIGLFLGVIGIFIGCLMPYYSGTQSSTRRYQSTQNLKQIGLALHNYHAAYGRFPPAVLCDRAGKPLYSWRVAILPFLDEAELSAKFHYAEPWDSPHNWGLLERMPKVFAAPGLSTYRALTETPYQALIGPGMAFDNPAGATLGPPGDFPDGADRTIMVVPSEDLVPWTAPGVVPWTAREDQWISDRSVGSYGGDFEGPDTKNEGFNALFVDGSVRYIRLTTPRRILLALFTRNGGEAIRSDEF